MLPFSWLIYATKAKAAFVILQRKYFLQVKSNINIKIHHKNWNEPIILVFSFGAYDLLMEVNPCAEKDWKT